MLNELRHRILPVDLLHHRPQEAAFLLSLLHPIPWKRPSVKEILCSEVLVLLHRKLCGKALPGVVRRRQGQRQTSGGGRAERALLADVLRFMRRCSWNILLTGAVEHFMKINCKSQLYMAGTAVAWSRFVGDSSCLTVHAGGCSLWKRVHSVLLACTV